MLLPRAMLRRLGTLTRNRVARIRLGQVSMLAMRLRSRQQMQNHRLVNSRLSKTQTVPKRRKRLVPGRRNEGNDQTVVVDPVVVRRRTTARRRRANLDRDFQLLTTFAGDARCDLLRSGLYSEARCRAEFPLKSARSIFAERFSTNQHTRS